IRDKLVTGVQTCALPILYVACERSPQARQRAVEGGLHGRLRHFEYSPNFREGQLPETAQVHDRTKLRGQGNNGRMQRTVQLAPLGHLLGQRLDRKSTRLNS